MRRSYKYRIYPTPKQEKLLHDTLFSCFKLYNTALEHRREVYRISKKSISCHEQHKELPLIKNEFPEYNQVHSQILQDVLKRVDLAYQSFFRRVKQKGKKAGFPRYKSFDRYDSFCFTQSGFKISGKNRLHLSKIGLIKIKIHRPIPTDAIIKTCAIRREGRHWYCCLSCEVLQATPKEKAVSNIVGIDLGLTDFAVLSNGEEIKNPKYLKQSETKLKTIQSKYSKGKSKKVKRQLGNIHRKITNQRKDFQHKLSHKLVNTFDLIAYEDLKIKQMIEDNKYNLQKHISDASWGSFIGMIRYKAEEAGTWCIAVNPKGTTQRCSSCDTIVPKTLYERSHKCTTCGFEASRDYNAALNIHKLGTNLVNRALPAYPKPLS